MKKYLRYLALNFQFKKILRGGKVLTRVILYEWVQNMIHYLDSEHIRAGRSGRSRGGELECPTHSHF